MMTVLDVIYESTADDPDVLSEKSMRLIKEFEEKVVAMDGYKSACQIVGPQSIKAKGGKIVRNFATDGSTICGGIRSLVNDVFVDPAAHKKMMTAECLTSQPVCNGAGNPYCVAANVSNNAKIPCMKCGVGNASTPFGTAPCKSSAHAAWPTKWEGFKTLCDHVDIKKAAAAKGQQKKTAAYFSQQKSRLLPRGFDCDKSVPRKQTYARTNIAFGAPMAGFTTFVGDSKEEQQTKFSKWFVKDMWKDLQKIKGDIESKSDKTLRIYAICPAAMTAVFNKIFMNDGMLAMGSLLFVLFWMWTATGSFFLAVCGIYECFISLFLAMITFGAISKYIGFLAVMMIFVIIGIGADDIFVFLDAFKQSAYEPQLKGDLTLRFAWSYRRSVKAMFVTTATTCVSFLAAGFSEIPSISAFGFFAAMVVAWDFFMVITFFASATVIYSNIFEGKKGGHMCMDYKCCCCRYFTPAKDKAGWRAYKPLIILDSILVSLGVLMCAIGTTRQVMGLPMIGTVLLCIAAICAQAVFNMPESSDKPRTLEVFMAGTFFNFLDRFKKHIVGGWVVIIIVCTLLVAIVFRPATEPPKFLSANHDLMRYIDSSAEFGSGLRGPVSLHYVFGLAKKDSFDRSGVDYQAPQGEFLGVPRYSKQADTAAGTPAGQQALIKMCDGLRASDIVMADPGCKTAFHAKQNPTNRLPTLGTEVGHCMTGVYCFMYEVRDFLTSYCKPCGIGQIPSGTTGCNATRPAGDKCLDSAGAVLAPAFPAPDLHKVLKSKHFEAYMKKLNMWRDSAGHGHDNKVYASKTGWRHTSGGFVGFIGANFSMNRRALYNEKKEWYDKATAFAEAHSSVVPDVFPTSDRFNWMVTEEALYRNTIQSFIIAVIFAWAMLVLIDWNWWTGTLGFLAVVCVVMCAIAIMVCWGWELGIIESIAIITVVGVSVDYSVHLIHAYGESKAETSTERVKYALGTMGISLIGGVATTFGAALFLWFAQIQFFTKFGQFLGITVFVSLFVSFTFLMPLAMLVGPSGGGGQLCSLARCKPGQAQATTKAVEP